MGCRKEVGVWWNARWKLSAAVALSGVFANACSGESGTQINAPIRRSTANAGAVSPSGKAIPGLSEVDAVLYTMLWLRDFAGGSRRAIVRDDSSTVSVDVLSACGKPLYAESSYDALGAGVHEGVRRGLGDKWLVTLCAGVVPAAIVAVAVDNALVRVENGGLVFPFFGGGGEFSMLAIGAHTGVMPLFDADSAARLASALSGKASIGTPRLLLPSVNKAPQFANWRVQLSSPATVRLDRRAAPVLASEVYLGYVPPGGRPSLLVPASRQASTEQVSIPSDSAAGRSHWKVVTLRRRAGIATSLEVATATGGGL